MFGLSSLKERLPDASSDYITKLRLSKAEAERFALESEPAGSALGTDSPASAGSVVLISPSALRLTAEAERFELSEGFPSHAFQACALDRYATPPYYGLIA